MDGKPDKIYCRTGIAQCEILEWKVLTTIFELNVYRIGEGSGNVDSGFYLTLDKTKSVLSKSEFLILVYV